MVDQKKDVKITEKMYDILLRPIITEKTTLVAEQGKIVFGVKDDATKTQIQTALENYFKTKLTLGFKENKSLISGVKIKVGDFYIEDSSRSRLRELENILTE